MDSQEIGVSQIKCAGLSNNLSNILFTFLTSNVFGMFFKHGLTLYISLLISALLSGQNNELMIGAWREHVPFHKANSVSKNGDLIYCGTEAAILVYNFQTKELKRYTTIEGLSDVNVITTEFCHATNTLVIVYKNGNIDLLQNGRVTNIPFVMNANIVGDKSINNIRIVDELAYLSTGFGIVVLNVAKEEIKDTYFIGNNSQPLKVNDAFVYNNENRIYAATDDGVKYAELTENLADYRSWNSFDLLPDSTFNLVDFFTDTLIFNMLTGQADSDIVIGIKDGNVRVMDRLTSGGNTSFINSGGLFLLSNRYTTHVFTNDGSMVGVIYTYDDQHLSTNPVQAIFDPDRRAYWLADQTHGLVEFYEYGAANFLSPNGPNTMETNKIDIEKGVVWLTTGLHDPGYRTSFNSPEFNVYKSFKWDYLTQSENPELDSLYGLVSIAINPADPDMVYGGTWGVGLAEIRDGRVTQIYDEQSRAETGHTISSIVNSGIIKIGGLDFDDEGNLWMTSSECPAGLTVKTASGDWYTYNLNAYVNNGTILGDIVVAENGYKWILNNRDGDTERIVVYDDNGTIEDKSDDRYTALTTEEGKGGIPGSIAHCLVEDLSGAIWIGTNQGPAVFYNPGSVFDGNLEGQQIYVEQDGQTQLLLETEDIKTIAVDGANRKWFGTLSSGVFLMSPDGTTQINHFTRENSPIFSDEVNDIGINQENGEVFFCTSSGLISYKGTATEGGRSFSTLEVYPNPVRPEHDGVIAIKGLAQNSNVKITDVNGVLIFETRSNGGQAIWNGYSLDGRKANNGVYLVFCTDSNGETQDMTKLLFLNN